jgi:hypothetical protein
MISPPQHASATTAIGCGSTMTPASARDLVVELPSISPQSSQTRSRRRARDGLVLVSD